MSLERKVNPLIKTETKNNNPNYTKENEQNHYKDVKKNYKLKIIITKEE